MPDFFEEVSSLKADLEYAADILDEHFKNVRIARVVGSSVGAGCAAVTIGSAIAIPFTSGLTTIPFILSVVFGSVGAAASATSTGAVVTEYIIEKKKLKEMDQKLKRFRQECERIFHLEVKENDQSKNEAEKFKEIMLKLLNVGGRIKATADVILAVCSTAKDTGTQGATSAVLRTTAVKGGAVATKLASSSATSATAGATTGVLTAATGSATAATGTASAATGSAVATTGNAVASTGTASAATGSVTGSATAATGSAAGTGSGAIGTSNVAASAAKTATKTASTMGVRNSSRLMAAVQAPVVVVNAVLLGLSIYDLVDASLDLHNDNTSRAGAVLRHMAGELDVFFRDGVPSQDQVNQCLAFSVHGV